MKEHGIFEKKATEAATRRLERELSPDSVGLCSRVKRFDVPLKALA